MNTETVVRRAAISTEAPRTLEEAFHRVAYSPSAAEVARVTGFTEKDLRRWSTDPGNPSGEHRPAPARAIIPLTMSTGCKAIVEFIASATHGLYVPRPAGRSVGALLEHVSSLTAEFSDVQRACAMSLGDGVTPDEVPELDRELEQLAAEVEGLRQLIRRTPTDRKPPVRATVQGPWR